MEAIQFDADGVKVVEIAESGAKRDILDRVGDSGVIWMLLLSRVEVWVGTDSYSNGTVNVPASLFVLQLLRDIREGNYIASDVDRDHARELLSKRGSDWLVTGPCLVVGVDEEGEPAPLDENFRAWIERLRRQRIATVIRAAGELEAGVELDLW
jgi:hypothetical protein